MKHCPYCGQDYADEITACPIDAHALTDLNAPPPPVPPRTIAPMLVYPEYRWTAWDGVKCLALYFLIELLFLISLSGFLHGLPILNWLIAGGLGSFLLSLFLFGWLLFCAAFFARTDNLKSMIQAFGLNRRPTKLVWYGMTAAVLLQLISHFLVRQGWDGQISNHLYDHFWQTAGFSRHWYLLAPLILAPVFAEAVYRGFVYKAFRASLPVAASMGCMLVSALFSHWSQFSQSWSAALAIAGITVTQCWLREKSDSLWDCILCHFTFNASSLLFDSAPLG